MGEGKEGKEGKDGQEGQEDGGGSSLESLEFEVVLPAGDKLGLGLTHNDTHVAHGQIGCKVTTVQDGGMAAETGKIQVHDWIITVNGKDVSKDDKAMVVKVIKAAMASGEPVVMRFRRETVEGAAAEAVAAAVSALPTPGESADQRAGGVSGQSERGAGQGAVLGAVAATNRELEDSDALLACQAACTLVRRACLGAYRRKKRAMVAPDVLEEMAAAFEELCPADDN